ncbi:PREDICTED: elongation of very long chain fatty acids protein AAEL008004-like [Wasmannia auropunctata]|uniref:elongation of very long chain fatty acids protein AAEL008004-like n=1 Tax=Wasmannia auropunctata TaxID=64793 RepID=UPI0005EF4E22|nr:PREDICTED: elongation of very long chain fatty acids protein AAEL008004-like [Wasmannia auropunctata]
MDLREMYHYIFLEQSYPLTREWPLFSSPWPLMLITLGYIYFVLYAGPRYMKDRPPYELKTFILIYNMIQILANLWFVKEHISLGWFSEFSIICGQRDEVLMHSKTNVIKLFNVGWWMFLLRLFDYVETCVFVLRKKQNQVSALHIYHHVSILVLGWYYFKFILDERITFGSLLNCTVHVIMYTYYFLAAWSPELQQMISPIKLYITKLQMVQFIVVIIIMLQIFNPNCQAPPLVKGSAVFFIGNILIFLYLFYDFYKKTYTTLPKQKNN